MPSEYRALAFSWPSVCSSEGRSLLTHDAGVREEEEQTSLPSLGPGGGGRSLPVPEPDLGAGHGQSG